jgi:hypothetical protein
MTTTVCRTARGVIRYRQGEHSPPVSGTHRFLYAAPDRLRVEDERGPLEIRNAEWHYLRDERGEMQRTKAAMLTSRGPGHPASLLPTGPKFTNPSDFSMPIGRGTRVDVLGRVAWDFTLAPPPHKPYPLRVVVDEATGTLLHMSVAELDSLTEMTEFEPDAEIADDAFDWSGPYSTGWEDERTRRATTNAWLQTQAFPVPRWWPGGVACHNLAGDAETGAFVVELDVPGAPLLARGPIGAAPPWPQWDAAIRGRAVNRWRDDRWEWVIATTEPLSPEELGRVIESTPPD